VAESTSSRFDYRWTCVDQRRRKYPCDGVLEVGLYKALAEHIAAIFSCYQSAKGCAAV
jgi:hypothetical protein